MAKKSSASFQPEKLIQKSVEDIQAHGSSARRRAEIAQLEQMGDSDIDYTDIAASSEQKLAGMVRLAEVGPKKMVSVRLDADVLKWLQSTGPDYRNRINVLLREAMRKAAGRRKG